MNNIEIQISGREAVDCWYREGGEHCQAFDDQPPPSTTSGPSNKTVQMKYVETFVTRSVW